MDVRLVEKLKTYLRTTPVKKAWIFGSFSRDEESPESDIDILIELNRDVKLGFGFFRMIREMEKICGRNVDLVECSMLDSHITSYVKRDRILIYER